MTDHLLSERPTKRAYLGSPNFLEDDEEQFFNFSKAEADSAYSVVGMTNASSFMPDLQRGGDKEGTARELSSSGNSLNLLNHPEALDDATLNNLTRKGTNASTDVPKNDSCKAEPSNNKETADLNGNKIGKSNSSKSPSSTSTQQSTSQSSPPPPTNNKKRTRATPEQLAILEDTFKTNTSPNSKVREALAEKVNMSERSIQIWFQNRRAKMKAMQKRVHMLHEETMKAQFLACMPSYGHNLYPFRMPIHPSQRIALPRSYSTSDIGINGMRAAQSTSGIGIPMPQVTPGFWQSGPVTAPIPQMNASDPNIMNSYPFPTNHSRFPLTPSGSPNSAHGITQQQALRLVVNPSNPTGGIPVKMNDQVSISTSQPQQFTPPQEFIGQSFDNNSISVLACETLTIGSWRRISTTPTDLLCYYTLPQKMFTYHITNNSRHFKMEFSLSEITAIEFRPIDNMYAQIAIDVRDPPNFFMEGAHGNWTMCTDFTEDKQATRHMRHVMKGRSDLLKKQLFKFMRDDPQIAKVVSFLDTPIDTKLDIDMNLMCGIEDQHSNGQQNPPRRSSFPSGSIAENLRFVEDSGSLSDKEVDIKNAEIAKQCSRPRRSASVPLSPSDDLVNQSAASLATATSAMAQNASLQIDTSSSYLNLFNAGRINIVDNSPEYCPSPMELNSSDPSTPLDVFNPSPELIHTSPLLAQDPFVTLPQHNLTNLSMDTSNFSDDIAAALAASNGLPSVTNEDFASMFVGVGSGNPSDGSEFLNFGNDDISSSSNNLGLDPWVAGDVRF